MDDQPPAATKPLDTEPDDEPILSRRGVEGALDKLEAETGRTIADRDDAYEYINSVAHDFFFFGEERKRRSLARQRKAYRRLVVALNSVHAALWDALDTEQPVWSDEPSTLVPPALRSGFMASDLFMTQFRQHLRQVGEKLREGPLTPRPPYGNTGVAALIEGLCDFYETRIERAAGASKDRRDGDPFVRFVRRVLSLVEPTRSRKGLASTVSKELTAYRRRQPAARERQIALSDKP